MSNNIHYALEIFTDSTLTDATYGLKSGVFRFVTDRPNYTGTDVKAYGEINFNGGLYGSGILGCKAVTPGTILSSYAIYILDKVFNPYNANATGIYWNQNPGGSSWRDSYIGWVEIYIPSITGTINDIVTNNFAHTVGTPFLTFTEVSPGSPLVATSYFQDLGAILSLVSGTVAVYGSAEIDKNGTSIAGQTVLNKFYEDFLTKEAFSTNPSRFIDIISCGTYSTDNKFAFKIRDDNKFWNFCLDPLSTGSYDAANAINLTGRPVILWVSINDVFYQFARGRISNNPYTELDYEIQVDDDATLIHQILPPLVQTPTSAPASPMSSAGEVIPVVLGEVPFTKLLKQSSENSFIQINTFGDSAAAVNYISFNSTLMGQSSTLELLTGNKSFVANQLSGLFLSICSGDDASKLFYKIQKNDASTLYTPNGYFSSYKTKIYLDSLLVDSSEKFVLSYSSSGNHWFDDTDTTKALCYIVPASALAYSTKNTWWFQISSFVVNTFISNLPVTTSTGTNYRVYVFDSDTRLYVDISSAVNLDFRQLCLISDTAQANGKTFIFEPLDLEMVSFGAEWVGGSEIITDSDAIKFVTNRSRIAKFNDVSNAGYKLATTSIFNTFDLVATYKIKALPITYDDIYFLIDSAYKWINPTDWETWEFHGLTYLLYDNYGNIFHDLYDSVDLTYPTWATSYLGSGYKYNYNLIPNSFFPTSQIVGDAVSLFLADSIPPLSLSPVHYPYSTILSFKNFKKGGSSYDGTVDLQIIGSNEIKAKFNVDLSMQSGTPRNTWIKQIALIGKRSIDTISGDVYTGGIIGETVNNDGVTKTNNVYTAFRHILEYYDGIPSALIDYGNLYSTRGNVDVVAPEGTLWHVGRTLTERKNSIEYLSELCAHTFVGMFGTRTGKRGLKSFQNLAAEPDPTVVYDASLILNQSIESYEKSDISQLFNNFLINYSYDPALQTFTRSFFVANTSIFSTFPSDTEMEVIADSLATSSTSVIIGTGNKTLTTQTGLDYRTEQSIMISKDANNYMIGQIVSYDITTGSMLVSVGIIQGSGTYSTWNINRINLPTWYTCFGGLLGSYNFSSVGYVESKVIWDKCRASYVSNKVVKQAQSDISDLSWFIDRSLFDPISTWGTGDKSSAYYFLKLLAQWTTISKNIVTFSIPINSSTILEELLNYEGFNDTFYTNGKQQNGWVTGIELNPTDDSIRLTMTLLPVEVQNATPQPSEILSRLMSVQAAPLTSGSII
jgi:hypothetical protein